MPAQSWQRVWKKEGWIRRLCGRILEPSMAAHGVESWISSLRATRVNPSATPGYNSERTIPGIFGSTSGESSNSAARQQSSSKTWGRIFASASTLSDETWKDWVTALRLDCAARWKSARRTRNGNDSLLWPTTTTTDWKASGAMGYSTASGRHSGKTLTDVARDLWATPTAWDGKDGACAEFNGPTNALLGRQVLRTAWAGENTSQNGWVLNPRFAEILMGWPIGWTDLGSQGTESFPIRPPPLSAISGEQSMADQIITIPLNGQVNPDPFGDSGSGSSTAKLPARRRAPGEAAGTRAEHDAYDTDPALALACVEWVKGVGLVPDRTLANPDWNPVPPLVLEPTAGGGPFVRAAKKVWPSCKVVAVDIRPECQAPCVEAGAIFACADSTQLDPKTISRADLIITNPPFKLADELARHMLAHMKDGAYLAFLLSVTFIASRDRWAPWQTADGKGAAGLYLRFPLSYMVPIVPRPAFTGTSPKFEAALFVWRKVEGGAGEGFDRGMIPHAGGALIPNEPIRWIPPKRTRKKKGATP